MNSKAVRNSFLNNSYNHQESESWKWKTRYWRTKKKDKYKKKLMDQIL